MGKVLCFIKREIDGIGHINYNKFTLYLEKGPIPIAVGFRHAGAMSTSFEVKMLTTAREVCCVLTHENRDGESQNASGPDAFFYA